MKSISEIFGPLEQPYGMLSFLGAGGELWAPDRTGNYSEDCQLGRFYARELLGYIRTRECPPLLGHVCQAMNAADWSGVEVGFFHELSQRAATMADPRPQPIDADGIA